MQINQIPVASVVMPVYGTEGFVQESMDSILNQSFADFELIIICDEPSENLKIILNNYQLKDNRIRVTYRSERGLISALNQGYEFAKGKYIIRMDADDICTKDRFSKQINYMEQHPEIGVLGSNIEHIDEKGNFIGKTNLPQSDEQIRCELFFQNVIAHPTILIRKSIIEKLIGPYDASFTHAEDYELWTRCMEITKFSNLPQALLYYRLHSNSNRVSVQFRSEQILQDKRIHGKLLNKIGILPTDNEIQLHEIICSGTRHVLNKETIIFADKWLNNIKHSNLRTLVYPPHFFSISIATRWYRICQLGILYSNSYFGIQKVILFFKSPLSKNTRLLHRRIVLLTCLALIKPMFRLFKRISFNTT